MPSNALLEQKKAIVSALAEEIKNAASGVIVSYQGITVDKDTAMRKALREAGVKYEVVKNTLTARACALAGYETINTDTCLKGMTAIAISANDAIAPAKILKEYADQVESFSILAGFVDGEALDANGVVALSEIPSKLMRDLGSIQSPLYQFAYAIKAIVDKENGGAAEEAPAEA